MHLRPHHLKQQLRLKLHMRSITASRNLLTRISIPSKSTSLIKKANLGFCLLLSRSPFLSQTNIPRTPNSLRSISTSSYTLLATPTSLPPSMSSAQQVPPVSGPNWSYSPKEIDEIVANTIKTSDTLLNTIAALRPEEQTFESVCRALAFREAAESKEAEPTLFLQYVSTDEAVRNASVKADKTIQDYSLGAVTRVDIYQALLNAKVHTEKNGIKLNAEEERLMDRMILDRSRAGLGLEEKEREELLAINKKIMGLEVDFQTNCNAEKGALLFSAAQLDGVPQVTIDGYEKEGDKYRVTFKTPDIIPVFKYANDPATRKAAVLGYEGKTLQNAPLLDEIVTLRRESAKLLGFRSWSEYTLQVRMAKTPENVFNFLNDLEEKLTPLGEIEKLKLLELKKEISAARGEEFDGKTLNLWDYRYYDRLYLERTLNLDEEAISEYFPVSNVVPAILDVYRELLGVKVQLVPRTEATTWHEGAEMYSVWNAGKNGQEGDFLGYMYLDLSPRENKYNHAAVFSLIPGSQASDGSRNYPVVCMVANLAKPTATRPGLMKHQDVVTFFHEMGHAYHGLCSKTQFARFSGTAVARDFVEAPSQMLENWCWTPSVLKRMSSHYLRPEESLSDALITSIVASKSVNQGLFNLRQLFHGKFDMLIHTANEDQDLTKLWCDLREKVSLVSTQGEYVGGQSGFAHIAGGYSSGYYGYLYSQSYSADMWSNIFSANPMDPTAGKKYRDEILKVGGSRDEMDSLKAFLGREPNSKAFLESLMSGEEKSEAKL